MKKYTKKKVTEFLVESSAIEGAYGPQSLKDSQKAWDYLMTKDEITLPVILEAHRLLSIHSNLQPTEIGYLRRAPVWIGGREGMKWKNLEKAIMEWCFEMNQEIECNDTVCQEEWIKQLHITFEKIHPFIDFNGRVGRLLLLWSYVKIGLPIKIIYEEDRQNYYMWFRE